MNNSNSNFGSIAKRSGLLSRVRSGRVGPGQSAQKLTPSDSPTYESVPAVSTEVRTHTAIYTHFTNNPGVTQLLFAADKWTRVRLFLENAGPVSVGTKQVLTPVLSGKGILLIPDQEILFDLPRGDRLFIAAEAINRVKVILQPIPWQEQIYSATRAAYEATVKSAESTTRVFQGIAQMLRGRR